jgi:hypothetical protein
MNIMSDGVKRISPLEGFASTLSAMKDIAIYGGMPQREDALTTVIGTITIDTCEAFDTGSWETGVNRNGGWIIVQQYDSKEEAKAGHKKWISSRSSSGFSPTAVINVWGLDE